MLDRLENVLENAVTRLTGKELEVLLRWKGVPVSKMGYVAIRRVLYQQCADGGEEEEDNVVVALIDDATEMAEERAAATSHMYSSICC